MPATTSPWRTLTTALPLAAALLAGCRTTSRLTPSPPTAILDATPTGIEIPSHANLRESNRPSEWLVLGIAENTGEQDLQNPRVLIVLRDEAGNEIARRTAPLPADRLAAGAAWPYREPFRPSPAPSSVEAYLMGDPIPPEGTPLLKAEPVRVFIDDHGLPTALGRLTNLTNESVIIEALRLVGSDSSGDLSTVVDAEPALVALHPDAPVPFLAGLPVNGADLDWEAYALAHAGAMPRSGAEILDIEYHDDDQGNPFVTAALHNTSPVPLWIRLTGLMIGDEAWLAGVAAELPIPLSPGELVRFTLRGPGANSAPSSSDTSESPTMAWQLFAETEAAERSPMPVALEVIGYEPVGSTLFLRVRLSAPVSAAIERPTAFATINGPDGSLLSAGWSSGPILLGAGQDAVVTVPIPLPADLDLTEVQFDVRAAGLAP